MQQRVKNMFKLEIIKLGGKDRTLRKSEALRQ